MPTRSLFATQIYTAPLQRRAARIFNARLLREVRQLRADDAAGRRWSAGNYPGGGFTSYSSASRMHRVSPTFAALQRLLAPHLRAYCRELELDLAHRPLAMTDCWVNIMPAGAVHGLHLHPHATISGIYYVQVPRGAAGLKFEDPRLAYMMAAPPRRARCRPQHRAWVVVKPVAGHLVLFESWLRHEVPPNPAHGERVSVSFNYGWF